MIIVSRSIYMKRLAMHARRTGNADGGIYITYGLVPDARDDCMD